MTFSAKRCRVKLRNLIRRIKVLMDSEPIKPTPKQLAAISVIRKAILKPEATLSITPLSGIQYIECDNYYIEFGRDFVIITNGKFSYNIYLTPEMLINLIELFNRVIENQYQITKDKYDANALKNLNKMNTELLK